MSANPTGASSAQADILALLARILMAALFFVAGLHKVFGFQGSEGYFATRSGTPIPRSIATS